VVVTTVWRITYRPIASGDAKYGRYLFDDKTLQEHLTLSFHRSLYGAAHGLKLYKPEKFSDRETVSRDILCAAWDASVTTLVIELFGIEIISTSPS
ncbi:jg119, partial [Pararge aegeria aegeria]